jgi:predicted transcriptional regulator
MVKVTFTLDEETVRRLRKMAERTKKPQSLVVREAVAQYSTRDEKMTDEERERWLRTFDEQIAKIPRRPREDIDRELRELRAARRSRGRRHPID